MKLLHIADLHLGKKYGGAFPYEISQRLHKDIWNNLTQTINMGKREKIDFMLIAGDLYERDFFTRRDMVQLMETLGEAEFPIFIAAGNHDYLDEDSLYFTVEFPHNVHLFSTEFSYFDLPEKKVRIFGKSYCRDYDRSELPKPEVLQGYRNILLIHGDFGESNFLKLKKEQLLDYDYVALGHIHKAQQVTENCYYSGSLEPLTFKETGEHGAVLVEFNGSKKRMEFQKTAMKEFVAESLLLDGRESYLEILSQVRDICRDSQNLYRIILKGRHGDRFFLKETLEREFQRPYVEIEEDLQALYSIEELEQTHDKDFLGAFVKELKGSSHPYAMDALEMGLEYLLEEFHEN